ncbi:M56 family metallopeptidase [Flagellimonas zhangzhouensis]|uniref:Signal transducer regulating beta-lactamase production, contains metallopeptidase domain n=1 Tax=Flagellimonas zhangzhouensis TaxID=1073328 RepID=A0A1H2QPI1_9FLAO|nr:M56 family metallopeptidase [Allomuricauda zhangzhouensis]SDQ55281.1 BlaR1 peptidase M56 [Allomuricauda zhangzhouensis]SDW08800.1 Signal transducer regulating beta-lactamase production, contains metallopeptidase domain [Allomuricauda zhangzhouensis]
MEAILIYLLKSAAILGGFLAVYFLFLKRDTLFAQNRLFLLSGLILSLLFPLIKIRRTVVREKPEFLEAVNMGTITTTEPLNSIWSTENILLGIYLIITTFLLVRFIFRLSQLKSMANDAVVWKETPFLHIETEKKINPFSFFNYIFYNPRIFASDELKTILDHEKVHARQLHSLDILFLEVLKIVFWFNPLLWLYKITVKQNLEYLADHFAMQSAPDKKAYQYLMLKQAVEQPEFQLTNSFYNSLIKKRIVMLNQNQSKKSNAFKTLLILPLLGLFLVSFATETVYTYSEPNVDDMLFADKTVELIIDKNTTDEQLDKMKKDLAADDIDFSYTTVRNEAKEIIEVSIQISGKSSKGESFSSNYNSNSDGPIDPINVFYDDAANMVSIGSGKKHQVRIHKLDGDATWTSSDEKEIVIKKVDGSKRVIVKTEDGEEKEIDINVKVSDDGAVFISDDGEKEHVIVKKIHTKGDDGNVVVIREADAKSTVTKSGQVFIMKDSDDVEDIEVIGGSGNFFFIDTDGKDEPLYYIDGKKAKSEDVKALDPSNIKSMNVFKGDKAIDKYGKKAKDGVIEITTKKN